MVIFQFAMLNYQRVTGMFRISPVLKNHSNDPFTFTGILAGMLRMFFVFVKRIFIGILWENGDIFLFAAN